LQQVNVLNLPKIVSAAKEWNIKRGDETLHKQLQKCKRSKRTLQNLKTNDCDH